MSCDAVLLAPLFTVRGCRLCALAPSTRRFLRSEASSPSASVHKRTPTLYRNPRVRQLEDIVVVLNPRSGTPRVLRLPRGSFARAPWTARVSFGSTPPVSKPPRFTCRLTPPTTSSRRQPEELRPTSRHPTLVGWSPASNQHFVARFLPPPRRRGEAMRARATPFFASSAPMSARIEHSAYRSPWRMDRSEPTLSPDALLLSPTGGYSSFSSPSLPAPRTFGAEHTAIPPSGYRDCALIFHRSGRRRSARLFHHELTSPPGTANRHHPAWPLLGLFLLAFRHLLICGHDLGSR